MSNSFVFQKSYMEAIELLDESMQLEAYKAIIHYALNDELPENANNLVKAIFTMAKPVIDANLKNYNARIENGKRGGRPKRESEPANNEEIAKNTENIENIENSECTETEESAAETSETPKRSKRFKKPTLEEVKEYCRKRASVVNSETFYNFYESNGWMVGKNPMKDWKASVRNWEQNLMQNVNAPPLTTPPDPEKEKLAREAERLTQELFDSL